MYRILGADGKEYGPIPADQLRQWIKEGRANSATRVLAEGTGDWKPLAQFPEFSLLFSTAAPPVCASTPPPQYGTGRKTNSFAVTGFVLGLLSLTGGLCCFGLLFNLLGLVFSIIALSQIKNNPGLYDGKGIATAGLVLSILGLILTIGMALFFGLVSILGQHGHHGLRL